MAHIPPRSLESPEGPVRRPSILPVDPCPQTMHSANLHLLYSHPTVALSHLPHVYRERAAQTERARRRRCPSIYTPFYQASISRSRSISPHPCLPRTK